MNDVKLQHGKGNNKRLYLGVCEGHVGRVEPSEEVRNFHYRCGRVVDAQVRQTGSVHRPPVGNVGQEHLLCWKTLRMSNQSTVLRLVVDAASCPHPRKSNQKARSPRSAPGRRL